MTKLLAVIICIITFSFTAQAKDRILDQIISIQFKNTPIKSILKQIETVGKVKFSYNPSVVNTEKIVSIALNQKTIRYGLNMIFDQKVTLKEVSSHILILEKEQSENVEAKPVEKTYFIVEGVVTDTETKQAIPYASVYDIDSKYSVLADRSGAFQLKIPSTQGTVKLYYAKTEYRTAVKLIEVDNSEVIDGTQTLYKNNEEINKLPTPVVPKKVLVELEDKTISGELFSMEVSAHSENLKYLNENRWAQLSLVPRLSLKAGKNYQGILYNHFSLNILGGYSKGLKGLEIGGIANVLKEEAYGLQLGGIVNLVGGNFSGVQVSGIANSTKKDFIGIQIASISNKVRQDFIGIQVSGIVNKINQNFMGIQIGGISNRVNGKFNGIQIAGITSSAYDNFNGIQASGFTSRCKVGFNGAQFSGLINHTSKASYGLQFSGIQNIALEKFVGAQITGFMNSAIEGANIFQFAGLLNIANKNNGIQLVGIANYANQNNGLQIGLVNLSKTNKGLSLGLVNFVWNGYHKIEVFASETAIANLRAKSGVKRFYNIYSIGREFNDGNNLTSIGFGFGAIYNISDQFAISTDIEGIVAFNRQKEFTELVKFSPSFDYKLSDHFAIFAGPTFNVNYNLISGNELVLDNYSLYNDNINGDYINFWVGGQFGLRF